MVPHITSCIFHIRAQYSHEYYHLPFLYVIEIGIALRLPSPMVLASLRRQRLQLDQPNFLVLAKLALQVL